MEYGPVPSDPAEFGAWDVATAALLSAPAARQVKRDVSETTVYGHGDLAGYSGGVLVLADMTPSEIVAEFPSLGRDQAWGIAAAARTYRMRRTDQRNDTVDVNAPAFAGLADLFVLAGAQPEWPTATVPPFTTAHRDALIALGTVPRLARGGVGVWPHRDAE